MRIIFYAPMCNVQEYDAKRENAGSIVLILDIIMIISSSTNIESQKQEKKITNST